ncbi:uncharacterized protein LOC141801286 [Halichoeres trimaculatus]|uniref:uncharacterized protein LOC141801286 n=1 Tax=Halichoeres trimaculatus TaxID=147232 RepID=UPI003D9DB8A8
METEHDYSSPARRRRNTGTQREESCSGGSTIPWLVGVSFAVLCIVQATLNVALRLHSGGCANKCYENCSLMSAEQIRNLTSERDQLLEENSDIVARAWLLYELNNQLEDQLKTQLHLSSPKNIVIRSSVGRIAASRGSSVKLTCEVLYNFEHCGLLHVAWCDEEDAELTDPRKYSTTVSHSSYDGNAVSTQVVTEILHLTIEDSGQYQCNAACGDGESTAGRVCEVIVTD